MTYNKSRVITLISAMAITISAGAQSTLQDGIKMYNYKKDVSAQRILTPLAATDALANYYLGLSYLDAGDMAQAAATFAKYPEDPANISGTARIAFINKDAAKGMQIAKDLAAKSKKKDWAPMRYAADAIAFTTGGDYQQAIVWYTEVLTKTDEPAIHIGMGDTYRKIAGGGGDAMNNYEHITDKDPNNSLALSRIGDLWYDARNYPSALDNYAKAKNADSTNPLPYKALANAYARSGRYQVALQNIKRYLQLSDNTTSDKIEYLDDLYNAQSYPDAITTAKSLLSGGNTLTNANKTEIYGILGFSEIDGGDSTDALINLRTYFGMQDPKKITPGAYIQYGKLFLKLNQLDSASYYYSKGISSDTAADKTDTYRQIAEAFKTKKEYCKSADWYDNLVKANPATQPLDYFWRGYMHYYCKDLAKTLSAFQEYENKYPEQPSAMYWLGRSQAAIDSEAVEGTAATSFTKWLDMVGPNYDKKNDMKIADQYLLLYYYNKKDKDNVKVYKEKLKAIDPKDTLLMQIEEAEKTPGTAPRPKAKH